MAVTRILNEDDIVEAFVRHHAPLLQHHIFLDNGSTDRTIDILGSLKAEGFAITVIQNGSVFFFEEQHNTLLYNVAVIEFAAHWVVFLDCDEFVDSRKHYGGLPACLAAMPTGVSCVLFEMVNYHPGADDDINDSLVVRRIRMRDRQPIDVFKCAVRAQVADQALTIEPGNHGAMISGAPVHGRKVDSILLAHFPMRSPARFIAKAVMGRLKVLAAGEQEVLSGRSSHYTSFLQKLVDDPNMLLNDDNYMNNRNIGKDLIRDPVSYEGADLKYTAVGDDTARAIRTIAHYMEALAQHHGRLLDSIPAAREQASWWNSTMNRIL